MTTITKKTSYADAKKIYEDPNSSPELKSQAKQRMDDIRACKRSKDKEEQSTPKVSEVSNHEVIWDDVEEYSQDEEQLIDGLIRVRAISYKFSKRTHPDLPTNGNLFGTIVNANMTHLLGLMKIKAIKESK